jgi:prophage regulatory protein
MTTVATNPSLRLEPLPFVESRVRLRKSAIYALIAEGKFPKPIRLGKRAIAFDSREVDAWIESKIAARDQEAA